MFWDYDSSRPQQTHSLYPTSESFPPVPSDAQPHLLAVSVPTLFQYTTQTAPPSQICDVSHYTSHPTYGTFCSSTPGQHSSYDLLSSSYASIVEDGPSGSFDNTATIVGRDLSHKRKSTDDLAESRPTMRQRHMIPPSASQEVSEASNIRTQTLSDTLSHTSNTGPPSFQPTLIQSTYQHDVYPANSVAKGTRQNDSATDLWHFVFGSQQQDDPAGLHAVDHKATFISKPKTELYPFIGCSICKEDGIWKVWKNSNGCNKHIRRHFITKHEERYVGEVRKKGLKNSDIIPSSPTSMEKGKVRVIDCSLINPPTKKIYSMGCPELLGSIPHIDQGHTGAKDLPPRAIHEETISQEASQLHDKLVNDLAHLQSGISITYDIWADDSLGGFSAVTVHWCEESSTGDLVIKSELAALRYARGPDADVSLDGQLLMVLQTLGPTVVKNVRSISLRDHRSNYHQTPFSPGPGLRADVGCLHLNFDKTILSKLGQMKTPQNPPNNRSSFDHHGLSNGILEDIINRSRTLVRGFLLCVQHQDKGPLRKLAVALSQDYKMNWGSLLFMIECLLERQSILSTILQTPSKHLWLSDHEWSILHETREFLEIFHQAQLSLDFGRCESMSQTVLTYGNLRNKLRAFQHRTFILGVVPTI
ncbi:hypothetical protein QCA50_011214 [Cerrena zonata]|uniref:Uncharacterized protein n=1 Tax=Cerrena zonata TaxID=2478898 RepID=A0AAW0G0G5_9APHY